MEQSRHHWIARSVRVDENLESKYPKWTMRAMKGPSLIDLGSGPLSSKAAAEGVAKWMNDRHPATWDHIIQGQLREFVDHINATRWG